MARGNAGHKKRSPEAERALKLGRILYEKCELRQARESFEEALTAAQRAGDLRSRIEALNGLLRLAGEALDEKGIRRRERELDQLIARHPQRIPPMTWYCKGAVAMRGPEIRVALRYFHRYLRAVRKDSRGSAPAAELTREEAIARGWAVIAVAFVESGKPARARFLAERLLDRMRRRPVRGIQGILFLVLGKLAERDRDLEGAEGWYRRAHASFLVERNWYYHLHVLRSFARVARLQQRYAQAYWYLELLDQATDGDEFGLLRNELAAERARLQQDAVDLLIDRSQAMVKTRDGGQISLRKQYVLLSILEALSSAHNEGDDRSERGLSKAEIIERVWREKYRPEAHDNKLYYNINRLRKLIEPDMRKPQYLLNWREGYRLAPGLRVQMIDGGEQP